jgi:hypothetical protein
VHLGVLEITSRAKVSANTYCIFFNCEVSEILRGHKEMSSILPDQQRPRILTQNAGGGGIAGSQPMSTAVHMEPK